MRDYSRKYIKSRKREQTERKKFNAYPQNSPRMNPRLIEPCGPQILPAAIGKRAPQAATANGYCKELLCGQA
jgi:hypothetical protein